MHDYSQLYPSIRDYENHQDPDWWAEYPQVDREYIWTYPIALREMSGEPLWNTPINDLMSQNLSIYIHIPYCRRDCPFCTFMRIPTKSSDFSSYADCLTTEIKMYGMHPSAKHMNVSSIYFGGGTASLLSKPQIAKVIKTIHESFSVVEGVETTIECHPDEVNNQYLIDLKSIGINRVSFGVQSFNNRFLNAIGRKQNCKHSEQIIRQAVDIGFHSVSVDLMYRLPGQSLSDVESDLTKAIDMGIHSISA
jgi:oxygen-independent coproporphyrinogen-3 oxidase